VDAQPRDGSHRLKQVFSSRDLRFRASSRPYHRGGGEVLRGMTRNGVSITCGPRCGQGTWVQQQPRPALEESWPRHGDHGHHTERTSESRGGRLVNTPPSCSWATVDTGVAPWCSRSILEAVPHRHHQERDLGHATNRVDQRGCSRGRRSCHRSRRLTPAALTVDPSGGSAPGFNTVTEKPFLLPTEPRLNGPCEAGPVDGPGSPCAHNRRQLAPAWKL